MYAAPADMDDREIRAIRGSLLQGLEDVNFSNLPAGVSMAGVTGGLRPSAIGSRKDIGKFLETRGRSQMANPNPLPILPETAMSQVSQGNWVDDALGIAGMAAPIFEDVYRRPTAPRPVITSVVPIEVHSE